MRVIADVAIQVGLAGLPGGQFDAIEVRLCQRHKAEQVKQFLPPRHHGRVQAHRVNQDVQPFGLAELPPLGNELGQVDHRNLEWRELGDLEGPDFLVVDLGFVVGQRDGAPHAAGQQHGVLPHQALADVDEALVDGRDRAPILVLGLQQADFQAGDDRVVAALPNAVADLLGLGSVNEVVAQPAHHLMEVFLEVLLGAVVVDQVLDHVPGELVHAGIDGQPFIDDLAPENLFQLLVHGGSNAVPWAPCP